MIERNQLNLGEVITEYESGTLYLSGPRAEGTSSGAYDGSSSSSGPPPRYVVPDSAPVFLSASALDLGVAKPGFLPYGSTFGVLLSTNAATPLGLPDKEATAMEKGDRHPARLAQGKRGQAPGAARSRKKGTGTRPQFLCKGGNAGRGGREPVPIFLRRALRDRKTALKMIAERGGRFAPFSDPCPSGFHRWLFSLRLSPTEAQP